MLAPQKPSPGSDERHVKIRILRCVEQGVCCQEVLKAMAYTDNLDVLDTEAAYAITEFFWRQIQSMYLFDFLVEFVYLVLLMIGSYDVTRGQALRPDADRAPQAAPARPRSAILRCLEASS